VGNDVAAGDVWIEDVRLETDLAVDLQALTARADVVGDLLRALTLKTQDPQSALVLSAEIAELERALPAELRAEALGLDIRDPEQAKELLHAVGQLLLPRLLGAL
jgi:hypothetical protein